MPWSLAHGRLAIDVIDDLRVVDGTLWAATPTGLSAFGLDRDGRLRLDPDGLTWIRSPEVRGSGGSTRACTITDFEVEGETARVRCDHDSDRVFTGRLEPGGDRDVFRPSEGGDPFVERQFLTEEGSGYWDWRLVGRHGGDPGRLEVTLRGESLGLARGRFDFDHLTSIAALRPGRIELTSAVGGWYRQGAESLHVRGLERPDVYGGLRAAEVTRVAVSRQGETRGLCVETQPGTAFLLGDGAVRANARDCPEDLGSDAVWSYARLGEGLRMRSPGLAGGWALRGLAAGRLSDHVVLGPPVTGSDEAGPYHLAPTEAGVVRFDARGYTTAVYAAQHDGFEPGEVPPVLHVGHDGRPVYVSPTGVRDLETGEVLSEASFSAPEQASLTALEQGPPGLLRLRWTRGDEHGWTLLRSGDYAVVGENMVPLDAASWSRFVRGRIGWDDPSAVLGLRRLSGGWQLFTQEGDRSFEVPWKGVLRPIAVLPKGPRLFVVEPRELSEVRLDLGVEELFR